MGMPVLRYGLLFELHGVALFKGTGFHFQIHFRIHLSCVERNVAQPRANRVDVHAGAQQMCRCRVPQRVWTDSLRKK